MRMGKEREEEERKSRHPYFFRIKMSSTCSLTLAFYSPTLTLFVLPSRAHEYHGVSILTDEDGRGEEEEERKMEEKEIEKVENGAFLMRERKRERVSVNERSNVKAFAHWEHIFSSSSSSELGREKNEKERTGFPLYFMGRKSVAERVKERKKNSFCLLPLVLLIHQIASSSKSKAKQSKGRAAAKIP